ncbi:MAG: energy transducer TonB [Gammaproteobacteria bacterium]|jgi:protein TonB
MTAASLAPEIRPADRLGLALFFAAVLHGILILGVAFDMAPKFRANAAPTLNVILVQTRSEQRPKDAKYIAQVDQQASGRSDRDGRPSSPVTGIMPNTGRGDAPISLQASAPSHSGKRETRTLQSPNAKREVAQRTETLSPVQEIAPTASELIRRSLQIAHLSSEIRKDEEDYAKRPRIKYVDSVSAKSVATAEYLATWVRKVERVGNLNYPDEAVRRHLNGKLILNVLVDSQGRVLKATIASSSDHRVLDDAAKRIVKLASPFPPFPPALRKNYDQLMITRTWIFQSDNQLITH